MKRLKPETAEQASALLKEGYMPVGGGTDLLVRRHAFLKTNPDNAGSGLIFSTSEIAGSKLIESADGRFIVGCSAKLSDIINHPGCPALLQKALLSIAAPGIRNAATLAGNICNASPAADSLPALFVLNAEIITAGSNGSRTIPISSFITGPGKTMLQPDEIVIQIRCESSSLFKNNTDFFFRKVGTRAANALSKLSICAIIETENGLFTDFRLAVGACSPVVIRNITAESILIGNSIKDSEKLAVDFTDRINSLIKPIDDQRSTSEYRRNTALKIIRKLITDTADKYGGI